MFCILEFLLIFIFFFAKYRSLEKGFETSQVIRRAVNVDIEQRPVKKIKRIRFGERM